MTGTLNPSPTTNPPTASASAEGRDLRHREGSPRGARPATTEQPRLRVLPGGGTQQLTLPYEYEVAPGIPAVPPVPRHLHVVPGETPQDPGASVPEGLEPPGRWTQRLARAIAEVASGERPAGQLQGHVTREVQTYLALRGQSVARHPSTRATRGTTRLRSVRGVRVCPVAPGVVEASAVLVGNDRARALALRLEAQGDQWVATAVHLG